ncbi:MAG: hypothetical protein QNJ61_05450 [Desulfobacterales bacterium]|nr:hypothetical protein [Desulfobacterales bacterium]
MAETLKWKLSVEIEGGPKIEASRSVQVTAYDKVDVELPGAADLVSATPVSVDVLPDTAADRLEVLVLMSDHYGPNLTYTVDGGGAADVLFDGPQTFIGDGAVGLLQAVPQKIIFNNGLGEDVTARITILVGRQATA